MSSESARVEFANKESTLVLWNFQKGEYICTVVSWTGSEGACPGQLW